MKPKKELMRVVRSPEGEVSLDLRGKKPGRGAYVCPNKDCLSKALKSRAIERALEVKIEENLLDELKEQAEEDEDE
jgi:predicted RNA-binding protein YlxR (DUF448 family)